MKLLDDYTLVWGYHPPNDLELMKIYVQAFQKVFDNLDQAIDSADKAEVPAYGCELFGGIF